MVHLFRTRAALPLPAARASLSPRRPPRLLCATRRPASPSLPAPTSALPLPPSRTGAPRRAHTATPPSTFRSARPLLSPRHPPPPPRWPCAAQHPSVALLLPLRVLAHAAARSSRLTSAASFLAHVLLTMAPRPNSPLPFSSSPHSRPSASQRGVYPRADRWRVRCARVGGGHAGSSEERPHCIPVPPPPPLAYLPPHLTSAPPTPFDVRLHPGDRRWTPPLPLSVHPGRRAACTPGVGRGPTVRLRALAAHARRAGHRRLPRRARRGPSRAPCLARDANLGAALQAAAADTTAARTPPPPEPMLPPPRRRHRAAATAPPPPRRPRRGQQARARARPRHLRHSAARAPHSPRHRRLRLHLPLASPNAAPALGVRRRRGPRRCPDERCAAARARTRTAPAARTFGLAPRSRASDGRPARAPPPPAARAALAPAVAASPAGGRASPAPLARAPARGAASGARATRTPPLLHVHTHRRRRAPRGRHRYRWSTSARRASVKAFGGMGGSDAAATRWHLPHRHAERTSAATSRRDSHRGCLQARQVGEGETVVATKRAGRWRS